VGKFPPDFFTPFRNEEKELQINPVPAQPVYGQNAWGRFIGEKVWGGTALILIIGLIAVVGPWLTPFRYSDQILALKNKPPGFTFYVKIEEVSGSQKVIEVSEQPISPGDGYLVEARTFWFGSDSLGRDLFTRNWCGARISLTVGILTAFVVLVIGTVYGGFSGYFGGWIDELLMRVIEILSAVPFLLYLILLMVVLEPGLKTVLIAMGAVYWMPMARLVRGQTLMLKEQDYILAVRALGAGPLRIVFKHLIPNTIGPIIIYAVLAVPEAIFTESWLSFLGLGVSVPMASWGTLVNDGIKGIRSYPWQLFFPAVFISITIFAFNLIGDGLRDALDPKSQR